MSQLNSFKIFSTMERAKGYAGVNDTIYVSTECFTPEVNWVKDE